MDINGPRKTVAPSVYSITPMLNTLDAGLLYQTDPDTLAFDIMSSISKRHKQKSVLFADAVS